MYFPGHYEPDPPPVAGPSTFHSGRPWSPIRYDDDIPEYRGIHDMLGRGHRARTQRQSEDSVEALDLADYTARTLRRATADRHSAYPPFPLTSHVHPLSVPTPVHVDANPISQYPEYPPSPDTSRPFSAASRDTFAHAPPSLVSGTTHETHESYNRRPYSLPPFFAEVPQGRGPAIFAPSGPPTSYSPRITSPVIEADISQFPDFARGWYEDPSKKSRHNSLPLYPDWGSSPGDPYRPVPSIPSSQRDLLPWGSQRSETDGPTVENSIKEERIRMLERVYGGRGGKLLSDGPLIGSVDEKGALITVGPKKRIAVRWAQGILAFGASIASLYGALFIKPKPPAPPESSLAAYALYLLSVITLLLVFYLFAIRPCCCGKRLKSEGPGDPTLGGMMVLPVQGLPGGKKKNKGKKGKKGIGEREAAEVQVNLIVDPSMFGSARGEEHYGGSDDEFGSQASAPRRPRRGFAQGQELERSWNDARASVRRMIFVDVACMLLWAAVFVLILLGKRCPPGAYLGWCDSYNIGTAVACLMVIMYGLSVFFGIVDLHMSKTNPRTRT